MGDEFKSGGGPMNAAKDQATILSQNITGIGNISSGSGNVNIENLNIYAAGTVQHPEKAASPISPDKPGRHFGVPNLPPNYLERDDYLKKFRDALLAKGTKQQHVGVLGMGGLGKSVLAAALAHDPLVRDAFPDGIFWLRFGQNPDNAYLLELQKEILVILAPGQLPESLNYGRNLLNLALQNKRCLIIADDLWDSRHLNHFNIAESDSRLLLTTRDAKVIEKTGARGYELGLLDEKQARHLLAKCSNRAENALPEEATDILKECGRLALAVAAIGSMVRDEPVSSWQVALKKLQTSRIDKISADFDQNYDYENILRVFQVSVEALPQKISEHYNTLAIFPEDVLIPLSVLQVYWGYCRLSDDDPIEVISFLVKRSLLSRVDDQSVILHDLLRDYLIKQSVCDFAMLHSMIIESYSEFYSKQWHAIPYDEHKYFYDKWIYHVKLSDQYEQGAFIADSLIRNQHKLGLRALRESLEFVSYQLSDIAVSLIKESENADVVATCIKIGGDAVKNEARILLKKDCDPKIITSCIALLDEEAKPDAMRLVQQSNDKSVLISCLKLLDKDARDHAKRFLNDGQHPDVLSICLKILGSEAKEYAKKLLKNSSDKSVLTVCLKMLGDEAKDDAKFLLKKVTEPDVLITCLKMLGDEAEDYAINLLNREITPDLTATCLKILGSKAKNKAIEIIKKSNDGDVVVNCLKILGDEAKEEARRIIKVSSSPDVLTTCLKLLGDEAKNEAKILLKTSKYGDVINVCLKILKQDAQHEAITILNESQNPIVISTCLDLLGKEAIQNAKQLLQVNNDPRVISSCLKILGESAKEDARRLLKSNKDEQVLMECILVLGKEAKAEVIRLSKTGRFKSTRENCLSLLANWERELSGEC